MNWIKDKILTIIIGVTVTPFIIGIYTNTKEYPKLKEDYQEKFEDNKIQHERFDELFQQEITKREADRKEIERLNDEILILKTRLER